MSTSSEPISFRLASHFAEQLSEDAEKRGLSRGDYARLLVIDALSGRKQDELAMELVDLRVKLQTVAAELVEKHEVSEEATSNRAAEYLRLVYDCGDQLRKLREDFATGMVVLLTNCCGWDQEKAIDWMQQKLDDAA